MNMVIMLSVIYTYGLYLSVFCVLFKHRFYFQTLLTKDNCEIKNSTRNFIHRNVYTRVIPMYRKEYFGYEYFVLPDFDNLILNPHHRFRVYGIIHLCSECLILYKNDIAKTIISLDDKRYSEEVLEDLRVYYRNILLILNGGVILWQISLRYMIL